MNRKRIMHTTLALLVAVLLTTSMVGGTLAKYTTSVSSSDTARVATWGFTQSSISITDLFKNSYDNVSSTVDVIAPGTTGSQTFGFTYAGQASAPEVAYTFVVSTEGSECADDIKSNTNIQWKLDSGDWGTWADLLTSIQALDGNKTDNKYAAGTLPTAFNAKGANTHTVQWRWNFEDADSEAVATGDAADTALGNKSTLDAVTLKITITASQID